MLYLKVVIAEQVQGGNGWGVAETIRRRDSDADVRRGGNAD